MSIDIVQHLRNKNYPLATQVRRALWSIVGLFFRASPSPLYGWRNMLLRLLGAKIGRGVRLHQSVRVMVPWNLTIADHVVAGRGVDFYSLAPITLESHILISQGVHLCAGSHDYRQPNFPIMHAPIQVHSGVWIAADAFIGPGVTIGAGAVVGARAVVVRDVAANCVVAGNPAKVVKNLRE